jgi:hypothetical protein
VSYKRFARDGRRVGLGMDQPIVPVETKAQADLCPHIAEMRNSAVITFSLTYFIICLLRLTGHGDVVYVTN